MTNRLMQILILMSAVILPLFSQASVSSVYCKVSYHNESLDHHITNAAIALKPLQVKDKVRLFNSGIFANTDLIINLSISPDLSDALGNFETTKLNMTVVGAKNSDGDLIVSAELKDEAMIYVRCSMSEGK